MGCWGAKRVGQRQSYDRGYSLEFVASCEGQLAPSLKTVGGLLQPCSNWLGGSFIYSVVLLAYYSRTFASYHDTYNLACQLGPK
jgi:hypothetical protein